MNLEAGVETFQILPVVFLFMLHMPNCQLQWLSTLDIHSEAFATSIAI